MSKWKNRDKAKRPVPGKDTQRERLLAFREMTRNVRDFYYSRKWDAKTQREQLVNYQQLRQLLNKRTTEQKQAVEQ